MLPSTLYTMSPMQLQGLKLLCAMFFLQENTFFDLWVKVTRNVAQYPLHHVTYAATKFKVSTSNGLGGHTFTKNVMNGRTDRLTRD